MEQAPKALCAGADTARPQSLSPGSGTAATLRERGRGRNLTRMAERTRLKPSPRLMRGRPSATSMFGAEQRVIPIGRAVIAKFSATSLGRFANLV